MLIWRRGQGTQFTPHFHAREFQCSCGLCSQQHIDDLLLKDLEDVRQETGLSLTITSAFRCSRYQQVLRDKGYETAKGISSHEMGMAVDVVPSPHTPENMAKLEASLAKRFPNIGVSSRFIHVDKRPGGPRRWGYSK